MICARCATAVDHGQGRGEHCQDAGCSCQHRPPLLPPRYPLIHAGSTVVISADSGGEE